MYRVSIHGGTIEQITNFECDAIELTGNTIHYINCNNRFFDNLEIGESSIQSKMLKKDLPQAAKDILTSNMIFKHVLDNSYTRKKIKDVLTDVFLSGYFEKSFMRYVVTFICPQKNRKQENFVDLMTLARYTETDESHPLLFIDTSSFCTRSKGAIVATDGIYYKGRKYPYRSSFYCEEDFLTGVKEKSYGLSIDVALTDERYELADLLNLIFVYCYY